MPHFDRRFSRTHRLVLALAVSGGIAALGVNALLGSTSCGSVGEGQITESANFTPADLRRGGLHRSPINPENLPALPVPSDAQVQGGTLDGLALVWAQTGSDGALYQYFSAQPLDAKTTSWTFFAAGGVEFDRVPAGPDDYVSYLLDFLGERAVAVDVGGHKGALTWGDPNEDGLRPHSLTWSDGRFNYTLVADRMAAELVNLGRGIAC